ncbi:hypothetical protein THAOC_28201, partial [Thalassiosira oceanica]
MRVSAQDGVRAGARKARMIEDPTVDSIEVRLVGVTERHRPPPELDDVLEP